MPKGDEDAKSNSSLELDEDLDLSYFMSTFKVRSVFKQLTRVSHLEMNYGQVTDLAVAIYAHALSKLCLLLVIAESCSRLKHCNNVISFLACQTSGRLFD